MVVVVMIEGNVLIVDVIFEYNCLLIFKLIEMGVEIIEEEGGICVIGLKYILFIDVKMMFYFGFFIDM